MKKGKVEKKMINLPYPIPYSQIVNREVLDDREKDKIIEIEWKNLEIERMIESFFTLLVTNKTFIAEAKEARKSLTTSPAKFKNLTKKYSHLIE